MGAKKGSIPWNKGKKTGQIPWTKGRPRSEETKRKISEAHRGKRLSEEHKRKIGDGNRGKVLSDETKAKISASRKEHWKDPVYRERMSRALKGRTQSEETRIKISETLKRKYGSGEIVHPFKGKKHKEESRRNMSENSPDRFGDKNPRWGKHCTEETKRKIGEVMKKAWEDGSYDDVDWETLNSEKCLGRQMSKETRRLIGDKARERFNDPVYKDNLMRKVFAACRMKPNKPEQFLIALFKENNLPFKYVGDGSLIIGGKCPDFSDGNGRLIEHYGNYWHKGEDPQDRIDFFKGFGFNTLVIWELELSNPSGVLARVESFGVG